MNSIPPCESALVEFKRSWSDSIKKELVAFANSLGGELFIGVDDSGVLVGVDEPNKLEERIISMARDNIYPSVMPLLSFRRITNGGKTTLAVHVAPGIEKPYCTDPSDISTIYVRVGSVSMRASYAQIARFVEENNPVPWESRIAKYQELTFDYCNAFSLSRNLNFNPEQDFFYGFTEPKSREFTNLACLCSEQNAFKIVAAVFSDEEKSSLVKSEEFSGSILKNLQDANDFILGECLLRMEKPKSGRLERRNSYSVPPDAVREALVNMIAHRDYSRTPPCVVHITPSRVMFFSVGGPADLTEEEILLQIATNCRNVRLANFLKALHLMEGTGSGFSTICSAYNNIPLSQLIQVLSSSFLISLPRMIFSGESEDNRTVLADSVNQTIDESILQYLQSVKRATRNDIESKMKIARSTASYWLQKLVKEGRIYKTGKGKNTFYEIDPN